MTERSRKDVATAFLSLVAAGQVRAAFERHAAPGFRHHVPDVPEGAAGLEAAMTRNAAACPDLRLDVDRVIEDGDRIVVLARVTPRPGAVPVATSYILRFEAGAIAELWDASRPVPARTVEAMRRATVPAPLAARVLARLDRMFGSDQRDAAVALMEREPGIRIAGGDAMDRDTVERIQAAVLKAGEGDPDRLRRAVELATVDWRDVLVAAGFADDVTAHHAWLVDVPAGSARPPPTP